MLLRASGEKEGESYDLAAVTRSDVASGVPHERWLIELTERAIRGEWLSLEAVLEQAAQAMGRQQAVDALVVAAAFNGITRVADATGIPLDENTAMTTGDLRADIGIDAFSYEEKARRFS